MTSEKDSGSFADGTTGLVCTPLVKVSEKGLGTAVLVLGVIGLVATPPLMTCSKAFFASTEAAIGLV